MQGKKNTKWKDPQLDSFIPSIWYRGICYALMSFHCYFKTIWGCNLRGVLTDTQAQLGYIHHVCASLTPSRENFTDRIPNFPRQPPNPHSYHSPALERTGMADGQRTHCEIRWNSSTSETGKCQKARWRTLIWDTSYLFTELFSTISLCIQF